MLSLPKDIIIHISTYTKLEDIWSPSLDVDNDDYNYIGQYYPMWNLYATCKHFAWMSTLQLLQLCLDESIVTTNISGKYNGPHYDIRYNDIDYYQDNEWLSSEKCDKETMKSYPIVKYLIDKDDYNFIYINNKDY